MTNRMNQAPASIVGLRTAVWHLGQAPSWQEVLRTRRQGALGKDYDDQPFRQTVGSEGGYPVRNGPAQEGPPLGASGGAATP